MSIRRGSQGRARPLIPSLNLPPDPIALAGARPINTQKVLRLKTDEHKLSRAPICELTYHQFAFANWVRSCQLTRSVCLSSEIFLTSPNFLLTALLACGLLANFTTL